MKVNIILILFFTTTFAHSYELKFTSLSTDLISGAGISFGYVHDQYKSRGDGWFDSTLYPIEYAEFKLGYLPNSGEGVSAKFDIGLGTKTYFWILKDIRFGPSIAVTDQAAFVGANTTINTYKDWALLLGFVRVVQSGETGINIGIVQYF